MTYGGRVACLSVAFVAILASSAARADYVDFTTAGDTHTGSGSWTTTINGVTITVTPTGDPFLFPHSTMGFYGYAEESGYAGYVDRTAYGAFSVSFSEAVQIASLDLFDYYRYEFNSCPGGCAAPANNNLGSYSVNGGSPGALVTGAGNIADLVGSDYSYAFGGYAWDGDLAAHTFTQGVGQTGTVIAFQGTTLSFGPGVDYAERGGYFGVRGINFAPSAEVPELDASAATTALALLVGALALLGERRRRQTARVC